VVQLVFKVAGALPPRGAYASRILAGASLEFVLPEAMQLVPLGTLSWCRRLLFLLLVATARSSLLDNA